MKKGLAEKETVNSSLKEDLRRKELENEKIKEYLGEKEKEINLLKIKLKEEKEQNISMKNLIAGKEEEKKILKTDLAELEEQNLKIKCALEETEQDIRLRRERIQEKEAENRSLKKQLNEKEKEIKVMNIGNIVGLSEVEILRNELSMLQKKRKSFHLDEISHSPKLISHFTGLPNVEIFNLLLSIFETREIKYYYKWKVLCLTKSQQLLITLMKMRRNLSHTDLALRFGVSNSTVSNVIITWIHALHEILVQDLLTKIPSRYKNRSSMPKAFRNYASCRVILDCTEVFAANPKLMSHSNVMYSSYKHRITLKGLIGIAPNGTVTFLSELYGGSTSDKTIVESSGIVDQLVVGDYTMADKGFVIGDILPDGVSLNIPPFLSGAQLTVPQVNSTLSIAQARIHVERAIERLKRYKILDFIPGHYVFFSSKIFQVCGALTNFMNPLIKEVSKNMMDSVERD